MRTPIRRLVCAGVFAGLYVLGAAAANDPAPLAPIIYTLSFPERHDHRMHVEVEFPRVSGDLRLRMSRSSPGRYAAHDFARNVDAVTAFDAQGRQLPVRQTAPAEWLVSGIAPPSDASAWGPLSTSASRVAERPDKAALLVGPHADRPGGPAVASAKAGSGPIRIRYRVFGNRLDGTYLAVDATHAHINIPAALLWAVGRESDHVRVRIQPPAASWRVATQLFPTADPFEYTSPNLHYLVDSPIEVSDHLVRSFIADAPPLAPPDQLPTVTLALHHTGSETDADRFVEGLRRAVREQAALFGEYPAYDGGSYTFIADFLASASHDGMEHRNSTVLTGESIAGAHQRLLGLAAHEFFHGWNVERIRPRSLEPFNLFDLNPSGELWLAEGFTQYYEALTMVRAGLWTLDEALAHLGDAVSRVMTFPEASARSADDMSRLSSVLDGAPPDPHAGGPPVLSHYAVGAALALGFDLTLRDHSAGERSLDDFMRAMWRVHGRPQSPVLGLVHAPYTPQDIEERLAEVGGALLAGQLMNRFVRGREAMDYRRLLARVGLRLEPAEPGRASLGAILLRQTDARVRLDAAPPPGSPAALAGLSQADAILRIGDRRIDNITALTDALAAHRPGERVHVEFEPAAGGPPRAVTVRLAPEPGLKIVRVEADGGVLGDRERAFRSTWLTPRYAAALATAPR